MREGLLATFLAGVGESSIVKSASTPPHSSPICRNQINLDLKMGQTGNKSAEKCLAAGISGLLSVMNQVHKVHQVHQVNQENRMHQTLHYSLRPIESVQFRFDNFPPHFEGKCHFNFLIH